MNTEKKLSMMISTLEARIHREQIKAAVSKQYFVKLMDDPKFLLTILLIPAFIAGWQEGKKGSIHLRKTLKHYAKLSFASALAYIKSVLLSPFPLLKF